MYVESTHCRLCHNRQLVPVLHLGEQSLTGRFPRSAAEPLTRGPLELVKCHGPGACGLVQLRHLYDLAEMYGDSYGYRSSLNRSMVDHLGQVVAGLRRRVTPGAGRLVIDIGSNDGTLLSFYPPDTAATLVGVDPAAATFRQYYRGDVEVVADFFSAAAIRGRFGDRRADVVTSVAMFYDLPDPLAFAREVASVLSDDGVWFFEQSYLPSMLATGAYDTVCHEHLEYYAMAQVCWVLERAGLRPIDVTVDDTNGGSFAVTAAKVGSRHVADDAAVTAMLDRERALGLDTLAPYEAFAGRVRDHRGQLVQTLRSLHDGGKRVLGYGASTKGNVLLQYCGVTPDLLPAVAEVNAWKFGRVTPGTNLPIISEADAKARHPDYFLVLPWHFRENLLRREAAWIAGGGRMIFPLPRIEVVPA